jgi:membrane-bound metal-dependent hydrolase YbcI (DUF457 family)
MIIHMYSAIKHCFYQIMVEQIVKTRRKYKHSLFSLESSILAPNIVGNVLELLFKSYVFFHGTVTLLSCVIHKGVGIRVYSIV